jgi:hypothetical protein
MISSRHFPDHVIDILHYAYCLAERDDDALVVLDLRLQELAALAILEPFFADLVATDMEIPDGRVRP